MNPESKRIYNRLKAISDAQRELIKANPFPYLEEMQRRNATLTLAIREALIALSGADDFDYAQEKYPNMNPSLVETALIRNRKAIEILDAL